MTFWIKAIIQSCVLLCQSAIEPNLEMSASVLLSRILVSWRDHEVIDDGNLTIEVGLFNILIEFTFSDHDVWE